MDVRDGQRNRGCRCLERARQFRDLHLHVPVPIVVTRSIPGDHTIRTRYALDKSYKLRVHLHRQGRCAGTNQGRVANELNCVAETVQTADYHSLSAPGLAIPKSMRIVISVQGYGRALTPCTFEHPEQHPASPTPRSAFDRTKAQPFRFVEVVQRIVDHSMGQALLGHGKQGRLCVDHVSNSAGSCARRTRRTVRLPEEGSRDWARCPDVLAYSST